jgi:hypothetical protein
MLPEPDYDKFSYDDLIDVYENIDKEAFPERFTKINTLLEAKTMEWDKFRTTVPNVKAKRINDFFDSLTETRSEYHSNSNGSDYGSGDVVGCGSGDGGGGE